MLQESDRAMQCGVVESGGISDKGRIASTMAVNMEEGVAQVDGDEGGTTNRIQRYMGSNWMARLVTDLALGSANLHGAASYNLGFDNILVEQIYNVHGRLPFCEKIKEKRD
ncbi:hypothetical protein VPH35_027720 [Triticum aestivum]